MCPKEDAHHVYALRSNAKRTKPTVQSKANQNQLGASILKNKFPIVVLHDIRLELAKRSKCPEITDKSHLMNLNDHCILEMFEYLPLNDFCMMAEVSLRLNVLAKYFFRVKYSGSFSMKLLINGDKKISMKQARRLLENFGHLITSLKVSRKWFKFDSSNNVFKGQRRLFSLINKYCPTKLTTLTLLGFWINTDVVMGSMPIFTRLQTLNYNRLSCYCPEMKLFCNFAVIVQLVFEYTGLTHQLPELVQLV